MSENWQLLSLYCVQLSLYHQCERCLWGGLIGYARELYTSGPGWHERPQISFVVWLTDHKEVLQHSTQSVNVCGLTVAHILTATLPWHDRDAWILGRAGFTSCD